MYPSRSALRKLVLRIYFDDLAEPCVEAPLGDFFGLGHAQTYAYASQPLAVGHARRAELLLADAVRRARRG